MKAQWCAYFFVGYTSGNYKIKEQGTIKRRNKLREKQQTSQYQENNKDVK